tara:strand:- start:2625 stop:2945 length:321 start_codon:yes stop_codon:yes gene_type:complete
MSASPVGIENVGYTITSAVRMHSEGECDWTSEDFWVVLGHNEQGEMVCWNARLLDIDGRKRWSFSGGDYVSGVGQSFFTRINREIKKMVERSVERSEVDNPMAVSE